MGQIRCDLLSLDSWDSGRQMCWFSQNIPSGDAAIDFESTDQVFWENYWDCQPCSYAARTGDQRSVIKVADFYSARQWHSTACTPIATGCWAWSTISWCACPARCRQPPGPGGMCG